MRMLRASVDFEFARHLATERISRQHALDSKFDDAFRHSLLQARETHALDAARITGVTVIDLALALVAGYSHLIGVDNNDKITDIDMRRVLGLVLATKDGRNARGEPSEHAVASVYKPPLSRYIGGPSAKCGHRNRNFEFNPLFSIA